MAWSKSTRIKLMLVLDFMFFCLELGAGFAVHSLALMADAFHMLNDIISLLVGLWAVSVARKATTDRFSYGVRSIFQSLCLNKTNSMCSGSARKS